MIDLVPDRRTVRPSGGTRYVLVRLPADEAVAHPDTVLVVERCVHTNPHLLENVVRHARPVAAVAFNQAVVKVAPSDLERVPLAPGSALFEAWVQGCLTIADEEAPQPGHCILITEGRPTEGPSQLAEHAAAIWENTGIATSTIAIGERPDLALLEELAWRGGGTFVGELMPPPEPSRRRILEVRVPPGVDVRALTRARHQSVRGGVLSLGVTSLPHCLVALTFRGQEDAWVEARLDDGTWQRLRFKLGPSRGERNAEVMALVSQELSLTPAEPVVAARPDRNTAEGAASLVARFVPRHAAWPQRLPDDLREPLVLDLYRGTMLWGAVGSALGRGLVGLDPASIRARYGPSGLTHYEAWLGEAESAGMVSGDAQMLREVAETVIDAGGRFDPEAFSQRLVRLLDNNRGIGNACDAAGRALRDGAPWWQAGGSTNSAGNGAALRAGPIGLAWALHPNLLFLVRDAVLSALPTHTHPVGVAAAVVMAAGVGWCVRERLAGRSQLDAPVLLRFLADLIDPLEEDAMPERRQRGERARLCDRIRQLEGLLSATPEEALLVTWNGSFALESIPAALYCFLHSPDDPRASMLAAVNGGFDADTVACMTGQLSGAWNGAARLREEPWWTGLEWRSVLQKLGDSLAHAALHRV